MKLIKIFTLLYGNKRTIIIGLYLPILLFSTAVADGEEVSATHLISKDSGGALSITSRKMTLKNLENTILFEGNVIVERDSMTLKARKVEVVFTSLPEGEEGLVETVDKKREISTITAAGDVEFIQGARTILSEKVTYYKKDEKMVFTGSPNVQEGEDKLRGERITVYIRDDRVVIEGGEAIIHPR